MKYKVLAVELSTADGSPLGEPRVEVIDTETNTLFAGARGAWDVEDTYHAFWNRLNDSWENTDRPSKVVVLGVRTA